MHDDVEQAALTTRGNPRRTPASGSDSSPSRDRMRMRPGRSVTIASPSGRKSRPPGILQPVGDDIGFDGHGIGSEGGRLRERKTGASGEGGKRGGKQHDPGHAADVGHSRRAANVFGSPHRFTCFHKRLRSID